MPNDNQINQTVSQTIDDQPPVMPTANVPGAGNNVLPPVISIADQPKRSFGSKGRRLVATLFGLLVLVGGLSAGSLLLQENQDVREKAAIEDLAVSCKLISVYKVEGNISLPSNWTKLTTSELSALEAGDVVYLVALAEDVDAATNFDGAVFTVNGVARPQVNTRKPSMTTITNQVEFYDQYTIPMGSVNFKVEAKVHHVLLGWI